MPQLTQRREARKHNYITKHRKLKATERRCTELRKKDRGHLIAFPKPVFAGYQKNHVVREDIARSPYAKDALMILPYVGRTTFCRRKDFLFKNRKTKQMQSIPHDLNGISQGLWKKEKLDEKFPPHLVRLFTLENEFSKTKVPTYRFTKPWWFSDNTTRYYFTHYREDDGIVRSELQRLQNKLTVENYWAKEYGHNYYDWDDQDRKYKQDPYSSLHWEQYFEQLVEDKDNLA